MSACATCCCVNSNTLPMSYRLCKPGLRYEEEIRFFFLRMNQKFVSDHGKNIFIIHKTNLQLNWCGVFEPYKAWHEFWHSVPINHAQPAHMFQIIPRINRKYLSEQFQVICLCNDITLSLLR